MGGQWYGQIQDSGLQNSTRAPRATAPPHTHTISFQTEGISRVRTQQCSFQEWQVVHCDPLLPVGGVEMGLETSEGGWVKGKTLGHQKVEPLAH